MPEHNQENEFEGIRSNELDIHPLILFRWSPRAFLTKPVPEKDLLGVLEAARWAPSCFNEQPWRFLVARQEYDLQRMRDCLKASNRVWADKAPVLLTVLSAPLFKADGKPNTWHAFDAGTAWGYLALEAKNRGLIAHAMGGFSVAKVREQFKVPEEWGIHALVALGYRAPADELPAGIQEREHPTQRRSLTENWAEGDFRF